jgi:hypothetical protein
VAGGSGEKKKRRWRRGGHGGQRESEGERFLYKIKNPNFQERDGERLRRGKAKQTHSPLSPMVQHIAPKTRTKT